NVVIFVTKVGVGGVDREERVSEFSKLSSEKITVGETCEKNMDFINADSNLRYNFFDCTRSANDRLAAAAILRHPYQHRSSRPTHSGKRRRRKVVSGLSFVPDQSRIFRLDAQKR